MRACIGRLGMREFNILQNIFSFLCKKIFWLKVLSRYRGEEEAMVDFQLSRRRAYEHYS